MNDFGGIGGQRKPLLGVFFREHPIDVLQLFQRRLARGHKSVAAGDGRYFRHPGNVLLAVQDRLVVLKLHVSPPSSKVSLARNPALNASSQRHASDTLTSLLPAGSGRDLRHLVDDGPERRWRNSLAFRARGLDPGSLGLQIFGQRLLRSFAKSGAVRKVRDVGDVPCVFLAVKDVDMIVRHSSPPRDRLYRSTRLSNCLTRYSKENILPLEQVNGGGEKGSGESAAAAM